MKKLARDETPNDGAIARSLPRAVDRKLFTIPVCFVSNFVGEFEFEDGVLQCLGVDKYHLSVNAEASACQASKGHQYAIIAGFGIVIKVDKRGSGYLRVV